MSAVGLTLLLLAAEAAAPAVAAPAAPKTGTAAPAAPAEPCQNRQEKQGDIIICAERQSGYRLNPDLQEAKRELKRQRLKRPESFVHNDCATVGPMGCQQAGINLIGAALTAAEMAKRLSEGKEIGSMFITDPHPSEYQLYLAAKARREAEEADKKAAAVKAKAQAAEAAKASPPGNAPPR